MNRHPLKNLPEFLTFAIRSEQRCAVRAKRLPGQPARLGPTEEDNHIGDVVWRRDPAEGGALGRCGTPSLGAKAKVQLGLRGAEAAKYAKVVNDSGAKVD